MTGAEQPLSLAGTSAFATHPSKAADELSVSFMAMQMSASTTAVGREREFSGSRS